MSVLQYLMLAMCAVIIAGTPSMLVKAVRRKQTYDLVEIPVYVSFLICVTIENVWPSIIPSAPPLVHGLIFVILALWTMNFFGFSRWLFNRQKAVPVERN